MIILYRLGLFFLFLLVLILGLFFFLISEPGAHLIWKTAQKSFPEIILDGEIDGSLRRSLSLSNLKIRSGAMDISIDALDFNWRPEELLSYHLLIDKVKINGLSVDDKTEPEPESPSSEPFLIPEIELPVAITINQFELADGKYQALEGDPIILDQLLFTVATEDKIVSITDLTIGAIMTDTKIAAGSNGQLELSSKLPMDLSLEWLLTMPDLESFNGTAKLKGDLEAVNLTGNYSISTKDYGDWKGLLDLDHQLPADLVINELSINAAETAAALKVSGQVSLAETDPTLDLVGDWQKLALPDENKAEIVYSEKGNFTLQGVPENYQLSLKTLLSGESIPQGDWTLSGQGSTSSFNIKSLKGRILDGVIDLTGEVNWKPDVSWDLKLAGKGLNPSRFTPGKDGPEWQNDWPGKLSLSALISGSQSAEQLSATVKEAIIEGTLREYPLKAEIDLDVLNSELDLKKLNISSADSRLKANGKVGEKLALSWKLASPDLVQLYPKAGGRLEANGSLKGLQTAPQVEAVINGKNISVQDLKLEQIDSKISLDLDTKDLNNQGFDIRLDASELTIAENTITSINLSGSGSLAAHTLKTDVLYTKEDNQGLQFFARGGLKDQVWTGAVEKLAVIEKSLGAWQLQEPAELMASAEKANLGQLCVSPQQYKQSKVCIDGQWKAEGQWDGQAEIVTLPFELFETILTQHLFQSAKMDGSISANLMASGDKNNQLQASLQAKTTKGSFSMPEQAGSEIAYEPATINFDFDKTGARVDLDFPIIVPTRSPVSLHVSVPPFDPAKVEFNTLPITGKIQARAESLSFLMQFTPELEKLSGMVDVDLDIGGTAAQPNIGGYALIDAEFSLPAAGIHLKELKLEARGDNSNEDLTIKGSVKSGEGQMNLAGKVKLDPAANWPVNLSIEGDRFELVNLPEAWALCSPDLAIVNSNNKLSVKGSVTIPEAVIEPTNLEETATLSDDVVIVSKDQDSDKKEPSVDIDAKVKIILGDEAKGGKIEIKGPGFSGAIKGQVTAVSKAGKAPRGNGELIVYDGSYVAYGQDLEIEKGRIIFADGPLDNPGLDIRATRTVDEIIAGVHITGQASDPVLTLFSKPGMNQDNVLSYLLTGRPLSEASSSEGELLASAATSMGLQGGNMLAQGIGQDLGLDDFSVGGDSQDSAALQIGKYLTPKLYVSYGVGIFEPVTSLKMRYDLTDRWSVEGESGTNSGMDFLYKYER